MSSGAARLLNAVLFLPVGSLLACYIHYLPCKQIRRESYRGGVRLIASGIFFSILAPNFLQNLSNSFVYGSRIFGKLCSLKAWLQGFWTLERGQAGKNKTSRQNERFASALNRATFYRSYAVFEILPESGISLYSLGLFRIIYMEMGGSSPKSVRTI
jgi:hypothetical protein